MMWWLVRISVALNVLLVLVSIFCFVVGNWMSGTGSLALALMGFGNAMRLEHTRRALQKWGN